MTPSRPGCRHLLPLITAAILLADACSGTEREHPGATVPIHVDVVTLELSLDDDSTGGDFALVDPRGISVDAGGNIYLADECCLKVFRPDGIPLRRIGRVGTGPGEFKDALSVRIGPTGHIAAIDNFWNANIYGPDGVFLSRYLYRNEKLFQEYSRARGFTFSQLNDIVAFGPDRLLIDLNAMDLTQPGLHTAYTQLLYSTPDSLFELCHYTNHAIVRTGPGRNEDAFFQGSLLWCLLDGERILYTETRTDRDEGADRSRYHLIVLDPATMSTDTLRVPWTPEPLPPAIRNAASIYIGTLDMMYEINPVIQEIMAETEYYPPLKAVKADQGIVFAFHYSPADSVIRINREDVEVEPHQADIIDLATGRLMARAEFPFLPEVIRDGRAYQLYTPVDGYPALHVYRIDQNLYAGSGGMN
jgi:hypothetical protein